MKNIDIKAYLEAATASEDAWNVCNDKLLELEVKLTEINQIKAQIKLLLDNVSMSSSHLRSLIMDLENHDLEKDIKCSFCDNTAETCRDCAKEDH